MALPQAQVLAAQPSSEPSEPSMEDILASIRRIIASDQGVGAARQIANARAPAEPVARPRVLREPRLPSAEPAKEPVAHPGEVPPLTDLDALVFPPAPIEPEAEYVAPPAPERERTEARPNLHGSLFPPAEDVPVRDDVYDLEPEQLVPPSEAEPLISSAVGASVSSSFQTLADSMLMRDPEMLERIARDALRPMLKTWLDDNLPSMVERLVRAEIERVARGGRSRG